MSQASVSVQSPVTPNQKKASFVDDIATSYMAKKGMSEKERETFLGNWQREDVNDPDVARVLQFVNKVKQIDDVTKALPRDSRDLVTSMIINQQKNAGVLDGGSSRSNRFSLSKEDLEELALKKEMIRSYASDEGESKKDDKYDAVMKEIRDMRKQNEEDKMKAAMDGLTKKFDEVTEKLRQIETKGTGSPIEAITAQQKGILDAVNSIRVVVGQQPLTSIVDIGGGQPRGHVPSEADIERLAGEKGWIIQKPMSYDQMLRKMEEWKKELEKNTAQSLSEAVKEKEEELKAKYSNQATIIKSGVSAVTGLIKGIVGSRGGLDQGLTQLESMFNTAVQANSPATPDAGTPETPRLTT